MSARRAQPNFELCSHAMDGPIVKHESCIIITFTCVVLCCAYVCLRVRSRTTTSRSWS
jgi:hypothetical protein